MITEDKVTEIFCMADDVYKFFWYNDGKIHANPGFIRENFIVIPQCQRQRWCSSWCFSTIKATATWSIFIWKKSAGIFAISFPQVVSYTRFVELERGSIWMPNWQKNASLSFTRFRYSSYLCHVKPLVCLPINPECDTRAVTTTARQAGKQPSCPSSELFTWRGASMCVYEKTFTPFVPPRLAALDGSGRRSRD